MKSCILLLCGAVCLVQANYHNQNSGLRLQPRGKSPVRNLGVPPAIKKPAAQGGQTSNKPAAKGGQTGKKPLGFTMNDLGDMDNSDLATTGMKLLKATGHKTAVAAGFEAGRTSQDYWTGYTKIDGRKFPGNLGVNGVPGASGIAVHPTEVKAKAFGPSSNDGVHHSKAWAEAPRSQISAKIEPGGLAKVYIDKPNGVTEHVDDIHGTRIGTGNKQVKNYVSEDGRHMTTRAYLLRGGPGDSISAKGFAE